MPDDRKEGEIYRSREEDTWSISLLLAQLLSLSENVGKSRSLKNRANTINRPISAGAAHLYASLSLSQSSKFHRDPRAHNRSNSHRIEHAHA